MNPSPFRHVSHKIGAPLEVGSKGEKHHFGLNKETIELLIGELKPGRTLISQLDSSCRLSILTVPVPVFFLHQHQLLKKVQTTDRESIKPWLRPELEARWTELLGLLLMTMGPFVMLQLVNVPHLMPALSGLFVDTNISTAFCSNFKRTLIIEIILFYPFALYLLFRQWHLSDLNIYISFRSLLQGIGLAFVSYIMITAVGDILFKIAYPNALIIIFPERHPELYATYLWRVPWEVLIVTVIFSPIFEEVIMMGFFFNQLAFKLSARKAFLVMIAVRLSLHIYYGPILISGILVMGLIFSTYYIFTRNLYPVIIAHIVYDLFVGACGKIIFDPNITN